MIQDREVRLHARRQSSESVVSVIHERRPAGEGVDGSGKRYSLLGHERSCVCMSGAQRFTITSISAKGSGVVTGQSLPPASAAPVARSAAKGYRHPALGPITGSGDRPSEVSF